HVGRRPLSGIVAHYPLKGGNLRRRGSRRSAFLRKGRSGGGKKTVLLLSPSAGRGRFKKEGKFAGVRARVTVALSSRCSSAGSDRWTQARRVRRTCERGLTMYVLLVEDHKPMVRAIKQGLEEEGF